MKIVIVFLLVALVLVVGVVKFFPYSTFDVKYFLNRNFDTHYRLDTYQEFFGNDTNAFESAQLFNSGQINYQQYAMQRGYKIKVVPIEKKKSLPSGMTVGTNGTGGGGGGAESSFPPDCTMEWYSVDEEGNPTTGPGGCY